VLAVLRDPDRPDLWRIEVRNDHQNETVVCRVYGGELTLELDGEQR
jgi:hypothetical protein